MLAATLILFAREPAHILHAELWAEDGWEWYPFAYAHGVRSLTVPLVGYFQTISRLVGLAAQWIPLPSVPTMFASVALVIQAAPAAFLVSRRLEISWPSLRGRVLFALVYLMLPNTMEVYDNLTNAQWHLAILSFLVLFARAPGGSAGWAFDAAVVVVSGLSGPFGIVLAPVAASRAWMERSRATRIRAMLLMATVTVQAFAVLTTAGQRSPAGLGAEPTLLTRIVVQQVLFGGLFGQHAMVWLQSLSWWKNGALAWLGLAAGLGLAIAAFVRGPAILRAAMLCAGLLLTAALARPQVDMVQLQWPLMTLPSIGGRYWYVPMLAWIGVLVSLAASRLVWLRGMAIALLAGLVFGVPNDFRFARRQETDFVTLARVWEAAPLWTQMAFPVLPNPDRKMTLLKNRP